MKMRKILLLVTIIIFTFAFAGCGGGGSGDDSSDQGGASASVTDGIQGVIFSVPDDWTKDEVSKDASISYGNPAGNLTMGVTAVDKSTLKSFADIQEIKTVEEYYKYRTSPSKDDVNEKEFESASLLGQDGKTAKFKNGDGYVDVATYCMLDGVMYNFYMSRNYAYDYEGKVKPDAKVLGDDELAIYDEFLKSAKTGDGASLQMKGMKADHLSEVSFTAPEGFTPTNIGYENVAFESERGRALGISLVDQNNLEYYSYYEGEEQKPYASLEEYYKDITRFEGSEKIKIAGYDGSINEGGEELNGFGAAFMTKDAVYNIYMGTESGKLSDDDKAAFESFIKSMKKN